MTRFIVAGLLLLVTAAPVSAQDAGAATILLLPLRTVGVSDTTVATILNLLHGELQDRGVRAVVPAGFDRGWPEAAAACADDECAAARARDAGTPRVLFGSLSRLGETIVAQFRGVAAEDGSIFFAHRFRPEREEDLDRVVRRVAESIAAGRADCEEATVESVLRTESETPLRKSTRSGLGPRAGFVFPAGDSYGGDDRLTTLRLAYKAEFSRFFLEATTLLGVTWGHNSVEWNIFDLYAARIFGTGDLAWYLGGGLGVHTIRVEQEVLRTELGGTYVYTDIEEQSVTTLTTDAGLGLIWPRTYGFQIIVDLRYHYVWDDFDELQVHGGAKGAHGFVLTFGTSS